MARSVVQLVCGYCGQCYEVERRRKENSKYCSVKCKNDSATVNHKLNCVTCGNVFKPGRKGQTACSLPCRKRNSRKEYANTGAKYAAWAIRKCNGCGVDVERRIKDFRESTFCSRACFLKNGEHVYSSKGRPVHPEGTLKERADGYVQVKSGGKWIFQHRLVMEEAIGRLLEKEENVHHLNGNRSDNRIENLELWSRSQPPGQRERDKLEWAREIVSLYEPIEEKL